jgi:hypothetical protein
MDTLKGVELSEKIDPGTLVCSAQGLVSILRVVSTSTLPGIKTEAAVLKTIGE